MAPSEPLYADNPAFEARPLRVICVGAGYSGLTLAYKVQNDPVYPFLELKIYEKNKEIGGTWYENVYPGVACDIPAHVYTFPFAPNPDWSAYYVTGPEIQQYILDTADKYSLRKCISLQSKVVDSVWDEESGQWKVRVEANGEVFTDTADILINATGFLSNWVWPKIPGLDSFEGRLVHTAAWDQELDCTSKRIALIGNGSSGIQVLPQIVDVAEQVTNFIRSPTWVSTPLAADQSRGGKNFEYSEDEKRQFREDPQKLREHRRSIEHLMNTRFPSVLQGSEMSEHARVVLTKLMQERLGNDEELAELLIPDFAVSCRRITPGEGYLEALQRSKIEFDNIDHISTRGIVTRSGEEQDFDIIICATGFDVSFCPSWPVVGKGGQALSSLWTDTPSAYFGLCAPKMPNYFIFNGPNSPVSQGSLLTVIEFASDYILRWCRKIATQGIKSVTVKEDVVVEFNEYSQEFLKRTVWAGNCRSWYKNGQTQGKITGIYGGSMVHFYECVKELRSEDFDLVYQSRNRFRFMGNGRTFNEVNGENLGYYLKH